MIALILGTSEGRDFLKNLEGFYDKIVISTATEYGGELLEDFPVAFINKKPLDEEGLLNLAKDFNLKAIVDASHPYAKNVSSNTLKVCKELNISYIRYERAGVLEDLEGENIIKINTLRELKDIDSSLKGPILNTTGSNGVLEILGLSLENRVIHRVLPSKKVMTDLIDYGVKVDDIIAIKGPISYELNKAFIGEYKAKALLTKDSGKRGGALEKARAAIDSNIKLIVLKKPRVDYGKSFSDIEECVSFIRKLF